MRILFIAHRLPYPPHKGEKIRGLNILKYLAARHEVHVACLADDVNDLKHVLQLQPYAKSVVVQRLHPRARKALALSALWCARESVTSRYFHSRALQRRIDALIERERIDAVFCSSSSTAEYVFRSRHARLLSEMPKVMDLIDVDSEKWRHYAAQSRMFSAWLYRREARCLSALEARIGLEFGRVLVVSEAERAYCDAIEPGRVMTMSNGVDLEYFSPRTVSKGGNQKPALVFTGVMDYRPNIDGVCWFVTRIWPRIRKEIPDLTLYIVGSRPAWAVRRLSGITGVVVTGFVPDVREYLAKGVCIAPLRIARGIQNKVLEAMAMGRAVVVTPQAFEGIDAVPARDLLVAHDAEDFVDKTVQLLGDPERARAMGLAARELVEKRYSWAANLQLLDELLPAQPGPTRNLELASQRICPGRAESVSRVL